MKIFSIFISLLLISQYAHSIDYPAASTPLAPKPVRPANGNPPNEVQFSFDELKNGGYVIFFRHTKRNSSATYPADKPLELVDKAYECRDGSELTAKGKEDAIKIGQKLASLNIPVGKVYASPTCRTQQMAELAFGAENFWTRKELMYTRLKDPEEFGALNSFLIGLVSTPTDTKKNRILLGHGFVLHSAGVVHPWINEGDAVIVNPLGNGQFKYEGIIREEHWLK